ncbi:MAG: hypothetical protein L6R38_009515 [Xanthoria sp. 2 TBL-2021]|nr:MAG: hypothetical protein L6R38_009515 [Xanthoria sp. 2 TBL-2021]
MVAARLGSLRPAPWVCQSCQQNLRRARQTVHPAPRTQKRTITRNYEAKVKDAEEQWQGNYAEIQTGQRQSMLDILKERGFLNAVAGGSQENLKSLMDQKRIGAYVGIDPTAPSLHVGHLVPLMALFWMYVHGFQSVTLIGGATASVGDPTGRTKDRESMSPHVRKANMVTMHYQLKALWMNIEKYGRKYGYEYEWAWRRAVANNNIWWNKLPFMEILRLLGPGLRVGTMLGRDTARNKMESGDGLSFAEFSYPVLQAYDWWNMYNTFQLNGVQLQIGGSDQYGNIMAGIEAVNYIRKNHYAPEHRQETDDFLKRPMGFTTPLLTTSSGEKFGKSAGNAIWLDKDMTSPFDLYQFFLRSSDEDVRRYLMLFSFMPLKEIDAIMAEHNEDPSKRLAQRRLAHEALDIIHGEDETKAVEAQHGILFPRSKTSLRKEARAANPKSQSSQPVMHKPPKWANDKNPLLNPYAGPAKPTPAGQVILPRSLVVSQQISRVLLAAGLVSSRSEGHRLIAAKGAYIGSVAGPEHRAMPDHVEFTPIKNWEDEYINKFIVNDNLLILRAGKWRVRVIKIVEDEEFERLGMDVPGWKEWKEKKRQMLEVDADAKH